MVKNILKNLFKKKKISDNPLKFQSWDDISIKQYEDIVNISNNEDLSTFEKNVKIISLLWNRTEEEIMNEDIEVIQKANKYTTFLNDFDFNNKKKPKTITINGMKCTLKYNIKDMTYAQFVDFQIFYQMGMAEHMQNILSTIIIPDGKKYGEGYDIDEFTNAIYNEMSITTAQSLLFFFAKSLVHSYNSSRTYLISQMKKMMKKEKNPKLKEKIQTTIQLLSGSTASEK